MAHITSIGAAMFSDLSIHVGATYTTDVSLPASPDSHTGWQSLFATQDPLDGVASATTDVGAAVFSRIENVREFPSMGTPPNIVNVPVYGQKTSQQIQGQADAPSIELTINYIPGMWGSNTLLGKLVGDGIQHAFRFTLLNAEPTGSGATKYSSTAGAATLGSVGNTEYYWIGKIEALLVNPNLTDATTATLTLSLQSDFYGAFTTESV